MCPSGHRRREGVPHCSVAKPNGQARTRGARLISFYLLIPATLNNHLLIGCFGETTIFYVMIWNHPVETTIKKMVV